jgi:hypothetical protein
MDTDLQKINCLVSNVMPHLSPFNLKANEKNIIVINSVMDAVKAYMKDKYDIMYFEVDSKDVDHITDIIWDLCDFSGDLSKEDIYNIIYNIISNDDIIFTYHSDECDIMEDFGVQQIFRLQDLKSPGMSSDDIRKAIIAGDIEEEKEFEKNNWIDNLIENT